MKKNTKKSALIKEHESLLTCMDYLHGDVIGAEYEAACLYEYSRESKILREAAEMHKKRECAIGWILKQKYDCCDWFIQSPWYIIYECPSFPTKSWNQLSKDEHREILHMGGFQLPSSEIPPLKMDEVWLLNSMKVFDEFKVMAEKRTLSSGPTSKIFPIIEGNPTDKQKDSQWVYALFTLDFSKTKKRLLQEFGKWLDLKENKNRLTTHKHNPVGKTGLFKDRLKDIASMRLYCKLGCDEASKFTDKNRYKDKLGNPRKFHDPREGQSDKTSLNQASLYREESSFLKAKARAMDYLAELIPWEFGKYAKEREQLKETSKLERQQWIESAMIQARKISKSSS